MLLFSCSKEKSKKWIVFDLNVVNAINGEAADANFFLSYYTNGGIGEDHETIMEIGNAWGRFEKTISVPRSSYNHVLKYRSSLNAIPNFYNDEMYSGSYPVSKKEKNEFTIEIDPIYHWSFNFNNVNCYDETDTLWLTQFDYDITDVDSNFTIIGCDGGSIGPLIEFDSLINFKYVVKRNGVISEYEESHTISWIPSVITIDY